MLVVFTNGDIPLGFYLEKQCYLVARKYVKISKINISKFVFLHIPFICKTKITEIIQNTRL